MNSAFQTAGELKFLETRKGFLKDKNGKSVLVNCSFKSLAVFHFKINCPTRTRAMNLLFVHINEAKKPKQI